MLPCIGLAPSGKKEVTAGLAESNGSLPPDGWLKVTCRLTPCTPGSAPGPTLENEYGRTLPLPLMLIILPPPPQGRGYEKATLRSVCLSVGHMPPAQQRCILGPISNAYYTQQWAETLIGNPMREVEPTGQSGSTKQHSSGGCTVDMPPSNCL